MITSTKECSIDARNWAEFYMEKFEQTGNLRYLRLAMIELEQKSLCDKLLEDMMRKAQNNRKEL